MAVEPEDGLREALNDIGPLLERHGFRLKTVRAGSGSGGPYAVATYGRGLWRVNVYFRDGLEPGWYSHAWHELPHSGLVPLEQQGGALSATEYARQIEEHADLVLKGDRRRFWRSAREAQRRYHRSLAS